MAEIQSAITIGYFCAVAGLVVTAALAWDTFRTGHSRFTLPVAAVMLILHPAWTVSAFQGDCGGQKIMGSVCFSAVYLVLIIYQFATSKIEVEREAGPAIPAEGDGDDHLTEG